MITIPAFVPTVTIPVLSNSHRFSSQCGMQALVALGTLETVAA